MQILPTLALNLQQPLLAASVPLLDVGEVAALEWSFDTVGPEDVPDWFAQLLDAFAGAGRLVGHGVFFSLFTGRWLPGQWEWLGQLAQLARRYPFDHITEHFGFMTGADFHRGAPMGVPLTPATLRLGQDRMLRLQHAVQCPVGLENLAFAFSTDEVARQGDFLEQLLVPVNGFIILDVHNLYCQLHNFGVEAADLLARYPLHRVREIHLSGGSWEPATTDPLKNIRRDTHNGAVPSEVFELLSSALPQCPNAKYVVLEQMGNSLHTVAAQAQFQMDFREMARRVEHFNASAAPDVIERFLPPTTSPPLPPPLEDADLFAEQCALSDILERSTTLEAAKNALSHSRLAHSAWGIETWDEDMLATAMHIAQKWQ